MSDNNCKQQTIIAIHLSLKWYSPKPSEKDPCDSSSASIICMQNLYVVPHLYIHNWTILGYSSS